MALIPVLFGEPLVHLAILLFKRLLKLLACTPHGMLLGPVRIANGEDLTHVGKELFLVCVLLSVHLRLHSAQVHGPLDLFEVVRNIDRDKNDKNKERTKQTKPETKKFTVNRHPAYR